MIEYLTKNPEKYPTGFTSPGYYFWMVGFVSCRGPYNTLNKANKEQDYYFECLNCEANIRNVMWSL